VSVGMSLVFNAASRLKEIASVYADPSELQNRPKASSISSTETWRPALVRVTERPKSELQPYSRRSDREDYLDNLFRMEMIAGPLRGRRQMKRSAIYFALKYLPRESWRNIDIFET